MSLRSAVTYIGNRLFEWIMALILLAFGVQSLIWPETLVDSNFRMLLDFVDVLPIVLAATLVGSARIAALIANGTHLPKWTPFVRAVGAGGGALLWGQVTLALMLLSFELGRSPSPGIPVYLGLTIGELFSCYRILAGDRHDRVR